MSQLGEARQYYEEMQALYWQRYRELEDLRRELDTARADMEAACKHDWVRDWEDRDERSRWICQHCNKSR